MHQIQVTKMRRPNRRMPAPPNLASQTPLLHLAVHPVQQPARSSASASKGASERDSEWQRHSQVTRGKRREEKSDTHAHALSPSLSSQNPKSQSYHPVLLPPLCLLRSELPHSRGEKESEKASSFASPVPPPPPPRVKCDVAIHPNPRIRLLLVCLPNSSPRLSSWVSVRPSIPGHHFA